MTFNTDQCENRWNVPLAQVHIQETWLERTVLFNRLKKVTII